MLPPINTSDIVQGDTPKSDAATLILLGLSVMQNQFPDDSVEPGKTFKAQVSYYQDLRTQYQGT